MMNIKDRCQTNECIRAEGPEQSAVLVAALPIVKGKGETNDKEHRKADCRKKSGHTIQLSAPLAAFGALFFIFMGMILCFFLVMIFHAR